MDEPCVRPQGFNLATYWEQSTADFVAHLPSYPATLRVASDALAWVRSLWRYARITHQEPSDAEGWLKLDVQFEVEEEASQYVLSLGPRVRILEPPELRDQVIRLAQSVVSL